MRATPCPHKDLAVAVGFRQSNDWRFLDLLRSANQYGLASGTGQGALIHLAKTGQDVVAPSSPHQRSEALLAAFRSVKDFEAVEKFYGGKRIPEDEFFLNTLTREFNIPRDRVEQFAKVFVENLRYLRAFSASPISTEPAPAGAETSAQSTPAEKVPSPVVSKEPRVREFLDTCFVMMPSANGSIVIIKRFTFQQSRKRALSQSGPMSCSLRVAWSNKYGSK